MSLASISLVSLSHVAGKVWPSFRDKCHVCKSFHTLSLFQLNSVLILIILLLQSLNLSLLINSAGQKIKQQSTLTEVCHEFDFRSKNLIVLS